MIVSLALALAPVPAPAPVADPNRKICKAGAKTGSRLGAKSVCKTRAQWEAEARAAQAENQDALNKPGSVPGG